MSVASTIVDLNSKGLLVNNLFQREDGWWQCNLREAGPAERATFRCFATGRSIEEALVAAATAPPTKVFLTKDMPVIAGKSSATHDFEDLL